MLLQLLLGLLVHEVLTIVKHVWIERLNAQQFFIVHLLRSLRCVSHLVPILVEVGVLYAELRLCKVKAHPEEAGHVGYARSYLPE